MKNKKKIFFTKSNKYLIENKKNNKINHDYFKR